MTGGTLTKYFPEAGLPPALRVGTGGAVSYLVADGLGSVDEALNPSGSVSFQQLFTAFGTVRYSSGTPPTSYGFTGQRSDSASGLEYFNARYYDPTGRQFGSADTVQDGLNAFAYVFDNPETLIDPSGHDGIPPLFPPWFAPFIGAFAALCCDQPAGESQAEIDQMKAQVHAENLRHFCDSCGMNESMDTWGAQQRPFFCDGCSPLAHYTSPTIHTPTTTTGGGTKPGQPPQTQPGGGGSGQGGGGSGKAGAGACEPGKAGIPAPEPTRTLYHGTNSEFARNILQNGVDRPFYTTENGPLAQAFAASRVTPDEPFQAILSITMPESVLEDLLSQGLLRIGPVFKTGTELEWVFEKGSWETVNQYPITVKATNDPSLSQEC